MATGQLIKALLSDPLAPSTRAKRRILLALTLISIAIVKAGLVPTSVGALGIDLTTNDQRTLLRILFWVLFYLLLAFILYTIRDILVLRADYLGYVDKELVQRGATADQVDGRALKHSMSFWKRRRLLAGASWTIAVSRWLLDIAFPIALGVYTLLITPK